MSAVLAPPAALPPPPAAGETLADLLDRLGVPAERVLSASLGHATEADVLRLLDGDGKRLCELVDGVLLEKPTGYAESLLGAAVLTALRNHVSLGKLGFVSGADGTLRLHGGNVRIPDVAFIARSRTVDGKRPKGPIPGVAPDLAVEILSPGNTKAEMRKKRFEYFGAGCRLVWEIDPQSRTVDVFMEPENPCFVLAAADTLRGEPVLPGFELPLAPLFAELDE